MTKRKESPGPQPERVKSNKDWQDAWLIECAPPIGDVLYFCNDGDWCSNPNHAHKFATAEEANVKRVSMHLNGKNYRVSEHAWNDS